MAAAPTPEAWPWEEGPIRFQPCLPLVPGVPRLPQLWTWPLGPPDLRWGAPQGPAQPQVPAGWPWAQAPSQPLGPSPPPLLPCSCIYTTRVPDTVLPAPVLLDTCLNCHPSCANKDAWGPERLGHLPKVTQSERATADLPSELPPPRELIPGHCVQPLDPSQASQLRSCPRPPPETPAPPCCTCPPAGHGQGASAPHRKHGVHPSSLGVLMGGAPSQGEELGQGPVGLLASSLWRRFPTLLSTPGTAAGLCHMACPHPHPP